MTKTRRPLLPYFIVPALPLLVPLVAMELAVEGFNWTGSDFVFAYVLFTGAGLVYRFLTHRTSHLTYRAGAAMGVFAGLSLIWVNLAVGFIGNEDNPANLLYGGVLAVGAIGAMLTRLEAAGMARTLFATAAAQFLVPIIAFLVWRPNFDANVVRIFMLNGFWVFLFMVSALLFKTAAREGSTGA